MWKLHPCEPERFTTEELTHRHPFPSENIQKNDWKPKTVNRAKTITVSSLSLWLQHRLLEGLNDFGFLQSETNVWVSSVTAEAAATSDGLAGERSTSWNYFEAVICICPGKHEKSNWDIVQNPPGDPHISGSLFLQQHCCIPLKVISITGKLALAIPRRVCSWLVSHLWNTQGSCAGMAGIWMSPHLQLLELLVFDSHPEITPNTRKGLEMEISLQDLNTKSRITIVSLAVLNKRPNLILPALQIRAKRFYLCLSPRSEGASYGSRLARSPEVWLPWEEAHFIKSAFVGLYLLTNLPKPPAPQMGSMNIN